MSGSIAYRMPAGLPDELWESRHAWMLRILYAHVPALLAVALIFGDSLAHAAQEAGVVLMLALAAKQVRSRLARSLVATAALLTCSALLVHFTDGLIEAHFHFFVAVTLLGFYENRAVYALAVVYVLIHHGVLGAWFDAAPVFSHPGHPDVSAWAWATVHAGFILMAGLANMLLARMNQRSRELTAGEAELRARAEATATALSASFAPGPLPRLNGRATVAAAYLPGEGTVSGDFYDVVDAGDGRIGIGVGDVAGHGPAAAGLSSKLRHTLRAYASDGLEPASVMDKLERALDHDGSATCAYMIVDPAAEIVTSSLAGHLPPVIVRPDGSIGMLSGGLSVPLAGLGVPHIQETQSLPAGSTLVVYTDGLVERRDESIDVGLRRLREAIGRLGSDPAALCEGLPRLLSDGDSYRDDVALVAVQIAAVGEALPDTTPMRAFGAAA